MISEPIRKLVMSIVKDVYDRNGWDRKELERDPEEFLAALLLNIKEDMTDHDRASLRTTVDWAFFDENLEEASRILQRDRSRRLRSAHRIKESSRLRSSR